MTSKNLSIRPFEWSDFNALVHLVAQLTHVRPGLRSDLRETMLRHYGRPGVNLERDCLLAWDRVYPVGYLFMAAEPEIQRGVLTGGVHPRHRRQGIGSKLIQELHAEAHLRGFRVLHSEISPSATSSKFLLRSSGFSLVRKHWRMFLECPQATHLPLPEGYQIRQMKSHQVESLTELQNKAFTGSWGFCPNTSEEIHYSIYNLPIARADTVLMLQNSSTPMGYCWTQYRTASEPGIIQMVGISPEAQGCGLGTSIVNAGVNHLLKQGATAVTLSVDSANPAAIRVYKRLGFRFRTITHWYESLI